DLRVAVVNESSGYGRSCGAETVAALASRGLRPLSHDTYDAATNDLDHLVKGLVAAGPDVLFASSFVDDAVRLLDRMRAYAYRPPAIMTSSAGFGLYTVLAAGATVDGVLSANAPALVNPAALN